MNRYVKLALYALAGTVVGWASYQAVRTGIARRRELNAPDDEKIFSDNQNKSWSAST